MSGSGRRRSSKWDLKEESRIPFDNVNENAWSGKAGLSFHDKESQHDWLSPEGASSTRAKWPVLEPLSGRRGSHRDDSIDEERNRSLKAMATWDGDESYGTRMSPGLDEWRQQNRRNSPKSEWKRSRRDYPSVSGRSVDCCNDFLKGNCRRGASCRFSHHVTSNVTVKESSNDVTRDKNSDRRHRDASPEKRSDRETYRASDVPCKFFAAGNCRNGKYCRFSHQDLAHVSPDRSRDGRRSLDQNTDDVAKLWNGPKWALQVL
ncbi:hypothetical protein GH714_021556 [Hevea brasiliensis]|uniref:C3H1-type domain-containing protein n=1 Tax=Hevea brasiliensis TaxID=3981 RepID=A0A6A6K6T4_HEVBR|nr:hypothetical protein GH714_021556 [Hevea brasiliensis]